MPVKKAHTIFGEIVSKKTSSGMCSYLARVVDHCGIKMCWLKSYELPIDKIIRFENELKANLNLSRKARLDRRNKTKENKSSLKR